MRIWSSQLGYSEVLWTKKPIEATVQLNENKNFLHKFEFNYQTGNEQISILFDKNFLQSD